MKLARYILCLSMMILTSGYSLSVDLSDKSIWVPEHIKAVLDAHSHAIINSIDSMRVPRKKYNDGVWQFDWLPGYYIKYGIERINGRKKIKKCIERYQLDLITVPQKWLYHIKGRPHTLSNDNYIVIAQEIIGESDLPPLTINHMKQFSTIIEKTAYYDLRYSNYKRCKDGTICLIDTEGCFNKQKAAVGYLKLIGPGTDIQKTFTREALEYLFSKIYDWLEYYPERAPSAFARLNKGFEAQPQCSGWDYQPYCYKLLHKFTPTKKELRQAQEKIKRYKKRWG